MLQYNKIAIWIALIALSVVIDRVISSPMYYKKTDDDTYEPGEIFELFDSMNH